MPKRVLREIGRNPSPFPRAREVGSRLGGAGTFGASGYAGQVSRDLRSTEPHVITVPNKAHTVRALYRDIFGEICASLDRLSAYIEVGLLKGGEIDLHLRCQGARYLCG